MKFEKFCNVDISFYVAIIILNSTSDVRTDTSLHNFNLNNDTPLIFLKKTNDSCSYNLIYNHKISSLFVRHYSKKIQIDKTLIVKKFKLTFLKNN